MAYRSFEDLEVWKKALAVSVMNLKLYLNSSML